VNVRSIAVIPARGGSKRIHRKNIRTFCGKPLIAWPIGVARASGLFDRVVVSTDDAEIAEIAKKCGAEVPFMRPAGLGDDHATTDSVVLHAVRACQKIYGELSRGCCIYPANPFLTPGDLKHGLDILLANNATSAFPVVKYDFPIEQAILLDGARFSARWPDKLMERSQDLPDHFHDAGMFYWFDAGRFLAEGRLYCVDSVVFVISNDRCQDINTPEDWARAELKYRILTGRGEP
jgi:pseudaminic acid cytidylyltransferase